VIPLVLFTKKRLEVAQDNALTTVFLALIQANVLHAQAVERPKELSANAHRLEF